MQNGWTIVSVSLISNSGRPPLSFSPDIHTYSAPPSYCRPSPARRSDLTCLHAAHPGGRVHLDAEAGVQLVGLLLQLLYRGRVALGFLRETSHVSMNVIIRYV